MKRVSVIEAAVPRGPDTALSEHHCSRGIQASAGFRERSVARGDTPAKYQKPYLFTETIDQFDGDLFVRLVDRVVVKGKALAFGLKTGVEIREKA